VSTLDCLDAYVDPLLAPDDFVFWLGSWFGAVLDENWPPRRRRAAVARSVALYRRSGTVGGMKELVELVTGGEVEIEDSGGVTWSQAPNTPPPGRSAEPGRPGQPEQPEPRVVVRVALEPGSGFDAKAIGELIAAAKPAHVAHAVEVNRR
jgi:tail protein P2 I